MTIDLRGFDYALEPLLRRRQWQLDALQARLGKIEEAIRTAQNALDELHCRHRSLGEETGRSLARRLDLDHHRRCLAQLTHLWTEIGLGKSQLATLKDDRESLRKQCRDHRHKVDVIEAHRDECIAAFAIDEARRVAAQADRDWLARASILERPGVRSQTPSLAIEAQT
jgi:SMC interacting uncharacterized protein involved in chromosome segregation